ncbi:MAG: hypothetical protein A3D74_01825 [Candidatus Levybacteria bacterium RIFCSPHIGHO2_02_FULL_37_13]|nr:MAG: hypothetical protein A3D74_01825 [Candidatus Levybacteria bacterium RIFCSPHIGHO2_02_FULL_37_13]OGH28986.1 MAG: hypothetical protein A3E40_03515 [Candidatus Levybacteria bacterium RIFCSPHIGHO2_12_FULL_37_9]OGH39438.1 MAG: hypothetical protein A3B41_00885 [Candidatus Levybacteria bacterium RIFCSPLOWO2_01_FULL_37_26]
MRKKIFLLLSAILLVVIVISIVKTSRFYPIIFQLLFNREIQLKKEDSNINILLLGTGGGKHEGPNLTDTIIFASIDEKNNKVTNISIPRDLWIPELRAKVNMAYASGEDKRKGGGVILAKAVIAKVLSQPIDYVVRIDFDGFVKAVDVVGGIEVDVANSFEDLEYPIIGKENDPCDQKEEDLKMLATASSQLEVFPCRYDHVRFDKGLRTMNGETALRFVRSRHAKGAEGTDFARSKRQEQVVKAFKDKIFSLNVLLNPAKVIGLYNAMQESIDTNIKEEEFDDFIKLAQKLKNAQIQSTVLDYGDEKEKRPGLLVNPLISDDFGRQWVLIPRIGNGDFSEIQKYIECEIKAGNCPIAN